MSEKKQSFIDKYFFSSTDEADENESPAKTNNTTTPKLSSKSSSEQWKPISSTIVSSDPSEQFPTEGHLDEKIYVKIHEGINTNDLPKPDWRELFSGYKDNLSDLDNNHELSMKTAFKSLSKMGLTLDCVLSSAEHYKQVVSKEKQEFENEYDSHFSNSVDKPRKEIEQLKNSLSEIDQKIIDLRNQKQENIKKISDLENKMIASEKNMQVTKLNYVFTADYVLKEIEESVNLVKKIKI